MLYGIKEGSATNMQTPMITKPKALSARRVLVLKGGWSAEREVSIQSGINVVKALLKLGHHVETFDPKPNLLHLAGGIANSFQGKGPDVIFNILHGKDVEDGLLQGALELSGIPYTFSGVLASALAMNKPVTRKLVESVGVLVPRGAVLSLNDYRASPWDHYPHVLKPLDEGSSVGVSIIKDEADFKAALQTWHYGDQVLVEDYIKGREIHVAVFGGTAMGCVELLYDSTFFSYEAKYTQGYTKHLIPPPDLPKEVSDTLHTYAELAHNTLGCRGVTRSDLIYDPSAPKGQQVFFLEINPQPGMTSGSLVPDIAKVYGWSYEDIVAFLVAEALSYETCTLKKAREARL